MAEFIHENTIVELGYSNKKLPAGVGAMVRKFNRDKEALYADPNNIDAQKERTLMAYSAVISQELQAYADRDLPDEEENLNPNNMLTGEMLKRAQAVGLTETATEAEVIAAETAKADADKAKADQDKADADKAKADADKADADKAKADADKADADKAKAEADKKKAAEDDDDIIDGIL